MRRLTWRNHSRDQSCHPRAIEHPSSTADLVRLVNEAEEEKAAIRAVGAGHSWSDAALTDGILVETDRLQGLLDLDDGTLRTEPPADRPLVRVQGGTRVRELNELLDARNLGLVNMGGYDAQAIAGVVSTSTHGSGITFGPFPDYVRSLDLVVAGGRLVRVEPSGGITDASAFAERYGDERTLVQDDALFYAAVCAMGCMGIVDSLVLEVRDEFWLSERRVMSTWKDARTELEGGVLDREEHYELFVNPYANKEGDHELLVTTRTEVDRPETLSPGDGMRHPLIEMQASIPLFWIGLRLAARLAPSLMRTQFGRTLRRMADPNYTQVSYRVFNIGAANKLPAYSMELGVPVKDDNHLLTVDRILQVAEECAGRGLYHTSPISLRFVAASEAYASMMYGEKTMMIELILVSETKNGRRLLEEYERRLAEFGSHPHWGQYNTLGADQAVLKRLYPRWEDWLAAHERFNASGVFNSELTDRIGISR
jgi:hypothetical protein